MARPTGRNWALVCNCYFECFLTMVPLVHPGISADDLSGTQAREQIRAYML
jgi:hypothetical protein